MSEQRCNDELSTCRNCDKPITSGDYCSRLCEDMDGHPAPRDDYEKFTKGRLSDHLDCTLSVDTVTEDTYRSFVQYGVVHITKNEYTETTSIAFRCDQHDVLVEVSDDQYEWDL